MISRNPGVLALLTAAMVAGGLSIGCSEAASEAAAPSGSTGSTVVARIGERAITQEELDNEVKIRNAKAFQAFYDARRAVLDQLISQQVLQAEASARDMTEEELLAEATAGLASATDAEVASFFNANTSRMGGRTLEEMTPQIRNYLDNTARQNAASEAIEALKKKYSVALLLEPPRMDVQIAANDPTHGPEDAAIVLVEFSDFQ